MKMRPQTTTFGMISLVLCCSQTATAQVEKITVGEVSATIDGASYAGATLVVPSEGTSTAEFQTFGPMTLLNIQAHDLTAENIMHNVISLEVSLMGDDVTDVVASWWPNGMTEPFYYTEGSTTAPQVTLNSLSLEEDASNVNGRFSALLCRKDSFFSEADTNDCLLVEGTFDTVLRSAD